MHMMNIVTGDRNGHRPNTEPTLGGQGRSPAQVMAEVPLQRTVRLKQKRTKGDTGRENVTYKAQTSV